VALRGIAVLAVGFGGDLGIGPGHAWLNCRQRFRDEWALSAGCSVRKHAISPRSTVYIIDLIDFDAPFPAPRHCHHFAVR
jgi:hypothetical protein